MPKEKLKKIVEEEAKKENDLIDLCQAGALLIIGFEANTGVTIEEIFENMKKWTYRLKKRIESEGK